MFHEVTDDPTRSGFQRPGASPYKHGRQAFARYLDEIAAGPCVPELIDEIDLAASGHHVLLTFDDGGKSALEASEQLGARGWKGHFFIVTSLIGTRTFLNAEEIRYLRSCGHVVGSHSDTHPSIFRAQRPERMIEEWRVSCERLTQLLGEPCTIASVPGGDVSETVFRSAADTGLRYLFTSEPWLSPRRTADCWLLGRFSVKTATTPAQIRRLAQFRGWEVALAWRRLMVGARLLFPAPYRWYVGRRTRDAVTTASTAHR
jgi:peptidoglycan/xylan/chitin deacetylase (PgdA/CDA1 family)